MSVLPNETTPGATLRVKTCFQYHWKGQHHFAPQMSASNPIRRCMSTLQLFHIVSHSPLRAAVLVLAGGVMTLWWNPLKFTMQAYGAGKSPI